MFMLHSQLVMLQIINYDVAWAIEAAVDLLFRFLYCKLGDAWSLVTLNLWLFVVLIYAMIDDLDTLCNIPDIYYSLIYDTLFDIVLSAALIVLLST